MKDPTWRTKDGQVLLIKYMASPHIGNTVNMLMRKNTAAPNFYELLRYNSAIGIEADKRYLFATGNRSAPVCAVPQIREGRDELCMLQAMIEVGLHITDFRAFYIQPSVKTQQLLADCDRDDRMRQLYVRYCAHRLLI